MKFINKGKDVQIRIAEEGGYRWTSVRTGETIDLPSEIGLRNGLEKAIDVTLESKQVLPELTEGKAGTKKVETKQFEKKKDEVDYTSDDLFFKELNKINGIGSKTARDIVVWGTKEKLIEVVGLKGALPFRDDVVKKLRRKYGK